MPVSETEKPGVSTSGRRLSNKVENIPIKKRRFLLRSPSPPLVNPVNLTDNQGVSEKGVISDVNLSGVVDNNDSLDAKKSDKPDEKLGQDEEFCGISILAAAACSYEDGLKVKDESTVHEGSNTIETIIPSKGFSKEDVTNSCKSSELASVSTVVNSSEKDSNVGKIAKVDSGDVSCGKNEELVKNPSLTSRDDRLNWDLNVVMDAWEQPFDDLDAQNDVSRGVSENPKEVDRSEENHNEPLTGQNKESHDTDSCVNMEQFHVAKDNSLTFNSNLDFDIMKSTIENTTQKCLEEKSTIDETQNRDIVFPDDKQVSDSCTMIETEGTSLKNLNLNDEQSGYHSIVKGFEKNNDIPSRDLPNLEVANNTHISLCVSSSLDNNPIELKSNIGTSKDNNEGNADPKTLDSQDNYEFMILDNNGLPKRDSIDSIPKRSFELQEGYDSQYEDGELRERAWEEHDRETENVDYISDHKIESSVDRSDYHVSNTSQDVDRKSGTQGASDNHNVSGNNHDDMGHDEGHRKKSSHIVEKMDPLSRNEPIEDDNKSFQDMEARSGDDNERKDKIRSYHIERSLDSGSMESRMEPRVFKRSLQSQVEGPVGRFNASRDEQIKKMDNRCESGSMRSFERIHYNSFQNQVRGRQGGSWDGSSNGHRGCRRHYSPINRGKRMLDNEDISDRDDIRYVDSQDDSPFSHKISETRGGNELDSCSRFDSRFKADRGRGFGRGRSFMYGSFGENRGGRGRYNGHSQDDAFQSSLKYRNPLSRRERDLSPFGGRGQSNIHHSRRKSPSRSRSRSPIIWNSARRRLGVGSGGGNTFLRHRSRSPNFRSETRIQRPRSPHQQPGFGVEHTGGFRPTSSNHGSPRRWNNVRKDEMGQFREQRTLPLDRSPTRIPLRGERGSGIDSSRNLKNDGYFRVTNRINDDVNRGVRFEENFDDRRKQYNVFRPTRRHYDDDMNDNLSIPNNFRDRDASNFQERGLRGFDNCLGEVSRRFRGENPSFVYERDGKFNNNSKQFGIDGMDSSSHNLKSDEQYQPKYGGRFSRYENYENRRKHYGTTHIIRREDNEDAEKRLNDDESFEATSGRVTEGL